MKILLGTDGSDCALGAARFLSRFPLAAEDGITVFHSVEETAFSVRERSFAILREIQQDIAPQILDLTAAALNGTRAAVASEQAEGHAADRILEKADALGADLIVMGSRGLKGRKAATVGSVTRAVAIGSRRPVLVVKPPQWDAKPPYTVLLATDGSAPADAAASFLAFLPFPPDSAATALYVSPSAYMDIPERFVMEVNDRMKDIVAAMKERDFGHAEEVTQRARGLLSARFRTTVATAEGGSVAEEILGRAASLKADIIAVGGSGHRGVRGMLGSVSRNILAHCECSVLIGQGRSERAR